MKVLINGQNIELKDSQTVADMSSERKITGSMFVIELNKNVVQKENYTQTFLKEGDAIEIVGFFGGG